MRTLTLFLIISFIVAEIICIPAGVQAQNSIKVVPAGEIKPEAGGAARKSRRRRRFSPPLVKESTEFLVALGTAVSSGLTQQGDIITLYAAENVGKSSTHPAIVQGALGRGVVTLVDKKAKLLSIRLESITTYDGKSVPISGTIELTGDKKTSAQAPYGARFVASLNEKVVVRSRPKKPTEAKNLTAFIELDGGKATADLVKGKAKGVIQLVLEAPKGYTVDDINTESVALAQVNEQPLALPIKPMARSPKLGDGNKNGTVDWTFWFDAWDFIKNQPEQTNTIVITGQMQTGETFEATSRVGIDY